MQTHSSCVHTCIRIPTYTYVPDTQTDRQTDIREEGSWQRVTAAYRGPQMRLTEKDSCQRVSMTVKDKKA